MKNIIILHGKVGYYDEILFGILIFLFIIFIAYAYYKAVKRKRLFSKNKSTKK
jgi:hypothetical protein|tara:strand:- start:148 stop:306 length:159 start_codon:yes stop_codon:yes gene_type:complete